MTREDRPLDEKGWLAQQALAVRAVDEYRAKLRAKVEALDVFVTTNNLLGTTRYVRLGDVLALIDGSK